MRTVLYPIHSKLHARMTEFAGFEMPVSYSGIIEEHRAVRSAAGLFDLSHMGEFELHGPHALELLERALTNSAARLAEGQAQYTLLCLESAGVIDDLIVYRLGPQHYMLCVNAANIDPDRERLMELNRGGADFRDISAQTALVAIQGPKAIAIAQAVAGTPLDSIKKFRAATAIVAGVKCLVARTGYTGEDGFELFVAAADATRLFEGLLDAGRQDGLLPCGLGARDTLRMEAGLPLYGHELDRETTPIGGRTWPFCKTRTALRRLGSPGCRAGRWTAQASGRDSNPGRQKHRPSGVSAFAGRSAGWGRHQRQLCTDLWPALGDGLRHGPRTGGGRDR